MKKITTEEFVPGKMIKVVKYVADDGTTFASEDACTSHEKDIAKELANKVKHSDELEMFRNFNGEENLEYHDYYWYFPKTEEDIEILNKAYQSFDGNLLDNDCIGKWICIEENYDDTWYSTLDDAITYASMILDKLGYKMTVEKVGDTKPSALYEFLKEEVPFRLKDILDIPEEKMSENLIKSCVDTLYEDSDAVFDYDSIDSVLKDVCEELGVYEDKDCGEITTVCYGKTRKWKNKKDAEKYFFEAMSASDGSEALRYSTILTKLEEGLTHCTDEEDF